VSTDEFENTKDDWTAEERRLVEALPLERIPPHALKERTARAVRGLSANSRRSPGWMMALVGAAAVIFAAGTLVGYVAATRTATPATDSQSSKREAVANAASQSPSIQQVRYVVWY
jgi:hypothetical protein